MDDLDVIRLAVAVIIAKERIAREGVDVKQKVWKKSSRNAWGDTT